MEAIAQIATIVGITISCGASATVSPINAYDMFEISRAVLYHLTAWPRRWRNWPIGIARVKPATAGIEVRRLIVKAVPPRRATRTGRNGEAALTTPIATESQRMIHALWMVSDAGRPARPEAGQRDRRVGQGGRAGEAPHDRGRSANARVEGRRSAARRHPTHGDRGGRG